MGFKIPVVLFVFKRYDTLERIIGRIAEVKPEKMYILADGPRNEQEKAETDKCRKEAERLITWDCELIHHYSDENLGVLRNIGLGAKWVLEQEEKAIFIEDDNLPEITFFPFCEELLEKYKTDDRILWICGTNYLAEYPSEYSYMFTRHMLPCGWASWSDKYLKHYDSELKTLDDDKKMARYKETYNCREFKNIPLRNQMLDAILKTKYLVDNDINKSSWDFQMEYSVRSNGMFGISPCNNQIANIGADELSTHGGTSLQNEMTKRFCGMPSVPMTFPLKHPEEVKLDSVYEKKIGKITLYPFKERFKRKLGKTIKKVLGMDSGASLTAMLKKKER